MGNRCCCSAKIASQPSISESGSTEVVTSPKYMPFDKQFPSPWLLITRNTSTKHPRRKLRTFSSLTTDRSWSPIPGGTSPKSSAVLAPERVTRNLIVKKKKHSIFHRFWRKKNRVLVSSLRPTETSRRRLVDPLSLALIRVFVHERILRAC